MLHFLSRARATEACRISRGTLPYQRGARSTSSIITGLALHVACAAPYPEEPCVDRHTQDIIIGGDQTKHVSLLPEQLAAVGALSAAVDLVDPADTVTCTGTLVAANWVLTAAHCKSQPVLQFRTSTPRAPGEPATHSDSIVAVEGRRFLHADRDVMLVELQPSPQFADLNIRPIRLVRSLARAAWLGQPATLVGFGDDGTGKRGARLSTVESIVEVDQDFLILDGHGVSGACHGDSGGPLLGTIASGEVRLLGLLSWGSNDCVGIDVYERADTLVQWVETVTRQAQADPCGDLGWQGTCSDNAARWCADEHVVAELCPAAKPCAWSPVESGYRCTEAVTSKGACSHG